jgi:hypothetical protein
MMVFPGAVYKERPDHGTTRWRMDRRFFFITRVPDEPGALERAAAVITECNGNLVRLPGRITSASLIPPVHHFVW